MRVKKKKVEKIHKVLNGRGVWLAFFVCLPFLGDLMIVVMGLMRSNALIVFISMSLGKLLKYVVWTFLTIGIINIFT